MLRNILSTTAIIALVSAGAVHAQDAANNDMKAMQNESGAAMESGTQRVFPDMQADNTAEDFLGTSETQVLASSLLGWPIYSSASAAGEMDQVGDVNDIVLGADGNATAVVIGVGGFLGVGEKDVAVSFDRLSWKQGEEGNWLLVSASREELENAPEFETSGTNVMRVGAINTKAMKESADNAADRVGNAANTAYNELSDGMSDMADSASSAMNNASERLDRTADNMGQSEGVADSLILDGMKPVNMETVSFAQLQGAPVLSADNNRVGEVSEVVMRDGQSEHVLIVDVGGFLGIGEKPIAIAASAIQVMSDGNEYAVMTEFDRQTLENQKAYSEERLQNNTDNVLLK